MGISGFLKNMKMDEAKEKKRIYDSIYIDCNYLLHYLIYRCKNDNELYNKTKNTIEMLLKTIEIKQRLNYIFDGKHPTHLEKTNPKKMTQEMRMKYKKESDDYDKQKIAPGMKIIETYKKFLIDITNNIKKILQLKFEIKINDDTIDDEADFKILNDINEKKEKDVCIVSKDSDMILIAYSLNNKNKMNIEILSNLKPLLFIDVLNMDKGYKLDYILMMLLLGNDYLPKLSNVNYEILINSYEKYMKHNHEKIIQNNKIKYESLRLFLTYITIFDKIKYNYKKLDKGRFQIYYNNMMWCLKKYNVIENDNEYIPDTNNVINIYNFIIL